MVPCDIPGIGAGSTMPLTRIKHLMKMKMRNKIHLHSKPASYTVVSLITLERISYSFLSMLSFMTLHSNVLILLELLHLN